LTQLALEEGQTFLYFLIMATATSDVTVLAIKPLAPKADYPRILKYHGTAPPQYPDYNEETGEMSWNPHKHKF
jgi:hypothetical protein